MGDSPTSPRQPPRVSSSSSSARGLPPPLPRSGHLPGTAAAAPRVGLCSAQLRRRSPSCPLSELGEEAEEAGSWSGSGGRRSSWLLGRAAEQRACAGWPLLRLPPGEETAGPGGGGSNSGGGSSPPPPASLRGGVMAPCWSTKGCLAWRSARLLLLVVSSCCGGYSGPGDVDGAAWLGGEGARERGAAPGQLHSPLPSLCPQALAGPRKGAGRDKAA